MDIKREGSPAAAYLFYVVKQWKRTDAATALDVSTAQTRTWLQRLVDEDVVEKNTAGYVVKRNRLT